MKGLLKKDFYILGSHAKMYLALLAILAFTTPTTLTSVAIFYGMTLPLTTMSYDEREKWHRFLSSFPCSAEEIVGEKYILGLIVFSFSGMFGLLVLYIYSLLPSGEPFSAEGVFTLLITFCIALIFMALNLPIVYKYGIEKSRLFFILIAMIYGVTVIAFFPSENPKITESLNQINEVSFALTSFVISIVITALSYVLSVKIYKNKEF